VGKSCQCQWSVVSEEIGGEVGRIQFEGHRLRERIRPLAYLTTSFAVSKSSWEKPWSGKRTSGLS
jgi:hypothetical protein